VCVFVFRFSFFPFFVRVCELGRAWLVVHRLMCGVFGVICGIVCITHYILCFGAGGGLSGSWLQYGLPMWSWWRIPFGTLGSINLDVGSGVYGYGDGWFVVNGNGVPGSAMVVVMVASCLAGHSLIARWWLDRSPGVHHNEVSC